MSDSKSSNKRGWGMRAGSGDTATGDRDYEKLAERVRQLEEDIVESRQLNKRIAELADVVAEVLLPAEQRNDEDVRKRLAKYDPTLSH
jgi:hypothetical protein